MAFQQLYYTSCERGLSGFSGFQFNAVSPGVTADTMHDVEALTGYEPPRSMLYSDDPEHLARCPVNLCFVPSAPSATAVCTRYVGRDSARRFGNYFAHALYTRDFAADGKGLLGIELWDSPDWTARTAEGTEIPPLEPPLRRGPLSPEAVGAFLAASPHAADQLPSLLAAAFAALEDGRSVVVVDSSSDRVAHWFAAVSFLLPPPLARELSFATYLHKPGRSRMHLIGALPETSIDIGPDDQDTYRIFDFAAGEFPPEGTVPVHHLVRLLSRIGVTQARSVWSWTKAYAAGDERYQGDWHAPLAAAAAAGGVVLEPADLRAVIAWVPGAMHLGEQQAAVARDVYLRQQDDLRDDELTSLSTAARSGGDRELHQELEGRLYESRMRAYMKASGNAVPPVPFGDHELRRRAVDRWRQLLREADDHQRVRLFLWAEGSRLRPPPEIADPARDELGRSLVESTATLPAADRLRAEVTELLALSPAFRDSLVRGVAEVIDMRGGQAALFSAFPAQLLHQEDLDGHPRLQEHYWVAQVERAPERAVDTLFRILRLRGTEAPDAELLRALWPHRRWTHREALSILHRLRAGRPVGAELSLWLDWAVGRDVRTEQELADCLDLCRRLYHPERQQWLLPDTEECVRTALHLQYQLGHARTAAELAQPFSDPVTDRWAPARALKQLRLPAALAALPVDPARVPAIVRRLGPRTAGAYLEALSIAAAPTARITRVVIDHVTGLVIVSGTDPSLPLAHRELITRILRRAAEAWRVEDTERLAAALRTHDPHLADWLAEQAGQRLSRSRKVARRLARRKQDRDGTGGEG